MRNSRKDDGCQSGMRRRIAVLRKHRRMAINNTGVLSGMNGLDNIRACGGYIKPVMHHYDALPFWSIRKAMVGEYSIRI